MSNIKIIHSDCLQAIPRLVAEGVVCDAVVTDPPYHLVQISERSKYKIAHGRDGAIGRLLKGFMGTTWDGGDIAFRPETCATVATILRPGAFLVAFGGTRTYHRLVCAIEDGGFVVQDQIAWMFGSGFPKRRDMLKPAFEPICLAYKPGGKRTMQVDECRIAGANPSIARRETAARTGNAPGRPGEYGHTITNRITPEAYMAERPAEALGRWPANVAHDGSDEVLRAFPESKGQQGDIRGTEPSATGDNGIYGHFKRVPFPARGKRPGGFGDVGADRGDPIPNGPTYADTGSAARFFFQAKADKQDRWGSRHPTVKPIDLIRWLVRLVTPPGGLVLDPFAGSGTTGAAAFAEGRNAILIEREDQYVADIRERMAWCEGGGMHSTAAKARRTEAKPLGGLFERPYDESADLAGSYYAAVEEIGRRVKAGEPVPECMLKQKEP